MKHSPGPWEHNNAGLVYGQVSGDDDEAPFVCDVIEDSAMQALGICSPTEKANATLIAAAPELLAAAKECLKLERDRRNDLKNAALSPAARFCDKRIAKIQAAINKAEGK